MKKQKQIKLELQKDEHDDDDEDISKILADLRGSTKSEDDHLNEKKPTTPKKPTKRYYIPKKQRERLQLENENKSKEKMIDLPPKDINAKSLYEYTRIYIFGGIPNDQPEFFDDNSFFEDEDYQMQNEPSISYSNFSESYFESELKKNYTTQELFIQMQNRAKELKSASNQNYIEKLKKYDLI